MASSSDRLLLFDTETHGQAFEVEQQGLDVFFPAGVTWTEVLDCRIPPYDQKSVEANCDFAIHVRKSYILVTAEQVSKAAPPTDVAD